MSANSVTSLNYFVLPLLRFWPEQQHFELSTTKFCTKFFFRRFEQLHLGIGDLDKFIWQMHFEDFSHLFLVLVGDVDWWQLKEENFSNSFNDNDDDAEDNCNDDDDDDDNDDEEEDDDDDESGCLT